MEPELVSVIDQLGINQSLFQIILAVTIVTGTFIGGWITTGKIFISMLTTSIALTALIALGFLPIWAFFFILLTLIIPFRISFSTKFEGGENGIKDNRKTKLKLFGIPIKKK